jgi:hypothetical protein
MKEKKKTLKFVVCEKCGTKILSGGMCGYQCEFDCVDEYKRPLLEEVYELVRTKKIKRISSSHQIL